jgi:hypothetical protein
MTSRRRALACAVVVSGAAVGLGLFYSGPRFPSDFLVYRYGCSAAIHGVDLYAHDITGPHVDGMPFTYTPFGALALLPTIWGAWWIGYAVLTAVSLGILGWAFAHSIPADLPHRAWAIAGLMLAAGTTCIMIDNVRHGQVNLLLMGLCLGDLHRRDRRWLPRGVLVGLAAAIKLTPGLFIVYFVLTRQWRLVRAAVIGAAAATLAGAIAFPKATSSFLTSALWTLPDRVDLHHPKSYWGNSSVTGALAAAGIEMLTMPAVLAVAVWALVNACRTARNGCERDAWLIVGIAAPLLSPYSWLHHHVYLFPALASLFLTRAGRPALRASIAAVLVVALHFGPRTGASWLGTGRPELVLPGLVMRESLLLLAITCIVLLARRAAADGGPARSRASVRWRSEAGRVARTSALAADALDSRPAPRRRRGGGRHAGDHVIDDDGAGALGVRDGNAGR